MKPSTKARRTQRTPAKPRPAVNPEPVETVADLVEDKPVEPEVVQVPEALPPADLLPLEPPQPESVADVQEAAAASPEAVRIGHLAGWAERMPVGTVLGLLGQEALDRIELLQTSDTISGLAEHVRVSDGRCAPVVLVTDADGKTAFFDGLKTLAAIGRLGGDECYVLTFPIEEADDLDLLQSIIARHGPPKSADDRIFQLE